MTKIAEIFFCAFDIILVANNNVNFTYKRIPRILVFVSTTEMVDRQFHAAGILFAAVEVRVGRVGRDGGIRFF